MVRNAKRIKALTLVEVLAAITILGGAVTTLLVAQSNSLSQLKSADLQLQAQQHARGLLSVWQLQQEDVLRASSGAVKGDAQWSWRRHAVERGHQESRMVTLEMIFTETEPVVVKSYSWLVRDE